MKYIISPERGSGERKVHLVGEPTSRPYLMKVESAVLGQFSRSICLKHNSRHRQYLLKTRVHRRTLDRIV